MCDTAFSIKYCPIRFLPLFFRQRIVSVDCVTLHTSNRQHIVSVDLSTVSYITYFSVVCVALPIRPRILSRSFVGH